MKVFGSDLSALDETARRIAEVLRTVPGAANVYPEPLTGAQYLNVKVDREAAARYGLGVSAVQDVIETAIGERVVTRTLEGRQRFPVRVRYGSQYRDDPAALGRVLVATPSGEQIPLAQVARFDQTRGAAMISSENGLLLATVMLNVQGRDVGGFVEDARAAVASRVTLPSGYYVGWSGQYQNQQQARERLRIIIPLVVVVIFILLYFTYHSVLEAAHVLLAVPFALTGGVYLLWLLDYNFSVAVWVGFIALFGTAVQTAVVMVIYLEEAVTAKMTALGARFTKADLREAVVEGALLRLRPKIMTASTVVAGLLPIMWSSRVGADVMKPLATPVLGGMVSSVLHVLIVTPVLFSWVHERRLRHVFAAVPSPAASGTGDVTGDTAAAPGRAGTPSFWTVVVTISLLVAAAGAWWTWGREAAPASATEVVVTRVRAGNVVATLSNTSGTLRTDGNRLVLAFRSASTDGPVDVGTVQLAGSMAMPGMLMQSPMAVVPTGRPGVYEVTGDLGMAGSWQMTLQWNGPAGQGSASFEGNVR